MEEKFYTLPDLPYAYDALEPVISKEIMTLHHDKHHKAYVDKANELLTSLDEARKTGGKVDVGTIAKKLSFNVDGHILHSLFWTNLTSPTDKKEPSHDFLHSIETEFGDLEKLKVEFSDVATTIEGSGWAILLYDPMTKRLIISQIGNHNLAHTLGPILLTLDMWEHSFYLDYKSDKKSFVENFWKVVNWAEVSERFNQAVSSKQ